MENIIYFDQHAEWQMNSKSDPKPKLGVEREGQTLLTLKVSILVYHVSKIAVLAVNKLNMTHESKFSSSQQWLQCKPWLIIQSLIALILIEIIDRRSTYIMARFLSWQSRYLLESMNIDFLFRFK